MHLDHKKIGILAIRCAAEFLPWDVSFWMSDSDNDSHAWSLPASQSSEEDIFGEVEGDAHATASVAICRTPYSPSLPYYSGHGSALALFS